MESSTTGDCCFAVCQSTRQSPICTRQRAHGIQTSAKASFAVCHLSGTRQSLCRVPKLTHGKKKQKTWEVTWRPPLPCVCRRGTRQSSNVCRVPWLWYTINIGFFAVCHGFCTRQRSLILYFLFVYCVYGTPNNTNSSHIS